MSWLAPAISIFGSLFGGQGGQSAAENDQNQINQWLIPLLQSQATRGMDPRVMMAAQSGNDAEFLRQMNSLASSQGPGYRGAGDLPYESAINDAMLNSQIAGQQQGIEDQARQELAGIGQSYGQQATQLPNNNPFMNIAGALSGGGGDALGALFARMFGGGGASAGGGTQGMFTPAGASAAFNSLYGNTNVTPGLGTPINQTLSFGNLGSQGTANQNQYSGGNYAG